MLKCRQGKNNPKKILYVLGYTKLAFLLHETSESPDRNRIPSPRSNKFGYPDLCGRGLAAPGCHEDWLDLIIPRLLVS